MLDAAVSLGRDIGDCPAVACVLPDGVAVISPISEQDAGITVALFHQVGISCAVVSLAGAQDDADGQPLGAGAEMALGREATSRTAKSLALSPPLKPAAQWCARTMVLSIICKASAGPPPSARASSITSQIRLTVQRRNCRCTEFHLPSSAGRARHGAPVRAIQKIVSSTRRWSAAGRPPAAPGSARNGLKNPHSSSLINPRTNPDLRSRSQRRITSHRVVGIPPCGLSTLPSRYSESAAAGNRCSRGVLGRPFVKDFEPLSRALARDGQPNRYRPRPSRK